MILFVILICMATVPSIEPWTVSSHHHNISRRHNHIVRTSGDEPSSTAETASPLTSSSGDQNNITSRYSKILELAGGDPRNLCHDKKCRWWHNFITDEANSSIIDSDDSLEDSPVEENTGVMSAKQQDLLSISSAILNFFNVRNNTKNKAKTKVHLEKLFNAIEMYFYHKNHSNNFGEYSPSDAYLEEIFQGILTYRNQKLRPDSDFSITFYINKIMAAINKYQEFKKKQDQLKEKKLQEDLRVRLQAILEVLKEFIKLGEAGSTSYEDQLEFLEEVLTMLLKYNKFRLNHAGSLSSLGIPTAFESEETFIPVFHAISVYKKKREANADSQELQELLWKIFDKIENHLKSLTVLPGPQNIDPDSLVIQILSALIRFQKLLKKQSDIQNLKNILQLLESNLPGTDPNGNAVLIKVFEYLLEYYQKYPDKILDHVNLKEVFVAIENYIKDSNGNNQGPDKYLEKVFATITILLHGQDPTSNNDPEIQVLLQILSQVLRYKVVLQTNYLKNILVLILKLKNAGTNEKLDNHDALDKIFKIILNYFEDPVEPIEDNDIQEIIKLIIKYNQLKQEGDPVRVRIVLKELFELIDDFVKKHEKDGNPNELVSVWIKILELLKEYYDPLEVVTEKITDLSTYLKKILNQLITLGVSEQNLNQLFNDLINVFNYVKGGFASISITELEPLAEVSDALENYVNHHNQANVDPELTVVLLEDIFYALQVYFSKNQKLDQQNPDLKVLNQILQILLKNHERSPADPHSAYTDILNELFLIIRQRQRSPASDVIEYVLKVIWNVFQDNPAHYNDPDFSVSPIEWNKRFGEIFDGVHNLPQVYVKQIVRLLIEYLTQPNTDTSEEILTKIFEITIKYQNHENGHPSNVITGHRDDRPIWVQIIDAVLQPDKIDIKDIDPNLKKIYAIIFHDHFLEDKSFTYKLVKILMKLYTILLQPDVPNQEMYKPLAQYLNAVINVIIDLSESKVHDEEVIVEEIIKVVIKQSHSKFNTDVSDIVKEAVQVIRYIQQHNTQKALLKILKVVIKYINAVDGNAIKLINYWVSVVGEDIEKTLIQILVTILDTHQYDDTVIDTSNTNQILKELIMRVLSIIKIREPSSDDDLRSIVIEFIKNILSLIKNSTKKPLLDDVLTIIFKIFDADGPSGAFNWQQILKILQLILSGQAKRGTDAWFKIIEILQVIINEPKPRPSDDAWIDIIDVLKVILDGKDPEGTNVLVKLILQIAYDTNKSSSPLDEPAQLVDILKVILMIFERNHVVPGPGHYIINIIVSVYDNPPDIDDQLQRILLILNLIINGNPSKDPELKQILKIIVSIIEKEPQDTTKEKRLSEILLILKLLIQNTSGIEREWKEIVKIVIELLNDNTAIGNPWEEILIILRPLIDKNPEQGPNLEKVLKLLIEIINNPSSDIDEPYKELIKIITLIIKKNDESADLKTIIKILMNFLTAADVKPEVQPVITAIVRYLEIVLSNGGQPVIDPLNLKLLTQTVITVDKYVNVPDKDSGGCCGFLKKLLKEAPLTKNSHYSYIGDENKNDEDVLANIVKEEMGNNGVNELIPTHH